MNFPKNFIRATSTYTTLDEHVPAPYFRRTFNCESDVTGNILITACGFYELYINGKHYTKGALAPYISNTDHYIYYDEYSVPLNKGKNTIGILLGNGFQNNPGGYIWDFDKAVFRNSPSFALSLKWTDDAGNEHCIESDENFLTCNSPITFDDYRFGEHYNANLELQGWNTSDFDDSAWKNAISADMPRGETAICKAEPIVVTREIKPVSITKEDDGYRYDFGENCAGVCRLSVKGKKNQQIDMIHVERLVDNKISFDGLWFFKNNEQYQHDLQLIHRDIYTCKGEGTETYIPRFTYHGFRYVLVKGITEDQATEDLLTYLVMNSDIKENGNFSCSDETANKLQEMTRRSDLANFYYFPTDCPQREKNGWTADAALSAEHMILNLSVETSYREWLRNICKAQNDDGMIPGIVPTDTWGYGRGLGPAWDCVLVYLPYYVYIYRGTTEMIHESAKAIVSYLHFLTTKMNKDGLVEFGLGDWCHVSREANDYIAPLEFTSSVMAMDIAKKAAFLFDAAGMLPQRDFADTIAKQFRTAIRRKLINYETMTAAGNCQTSQAMAIFYEVFDPSESGSAFDRLLEFIHEKNNCMDVGVLGGRVIFHVLAKFGYSNLAYEMITRPDYPSYGNLIQRGATSLWEQFYETDKGVSSMNHHFWGDISSWFMQYPAGIRVNPTGNDVNQVNIAPCFIDTLTHAQAWHNAPAGRIESSWVRDNEKITLTIKIPEEISGRIILESGYSFEDSRSFKKLASGSYTIIKTR